TITASLDGGKKAIADRDHQEQVVIKMMRQLSHYAEIACKDDMPTFLKSGFQPKSTARTSQTPLSQFIRKVAGGKALGQLLVILMAVIDATAYEVRVAGTVNGTLGPWTTQMVTKTRPAVSFTGLTPGTTYTIQVRSFADPTGFSEWSDPVTYILN